MVVTEKAIVEGLYYNTITLVFANLSTGVLVEQPEATRRLWYTVDVRKGAGVVELARLESV